MEIRELTLLQPAPLPDRWQLIAFHGPCFGCGFGPGDSRLWERGEHGEAVGRPLLETLTKGNHQSVASLAIGGGAQELAAVICTVGYCGGEGDPSPGSEAALYGSHDGGASWQLVGEVAPETTLIGFSDGELLLQNWVVDGAGHYVFSFRTLNAPLLPPRGEAADWVYLFPDANPIWLRYERETQLRVHFDDGGTIGRPAGSEGLLLGVGSDGSLLWRLHDLRDSPDALLYPTMPSGGPHTTTERRYAHVPALAEAGVLRVGLVDPGSVNIGRRDSEGVPAAVDATYLNTFRDARYMFDMCAQYSLGPSIAIFEPGFLRVTLAYHEAGALPRGAMVKLYFGGERSLFGLPPTPASLNAYLEMLEGSGLPWSVAVLGGDIVGCGLAKLAIERGGHVRVGLEDYGAAAGEPTNGELLGGLLAVIAGAGKRPATPDAAAVILDLPAAST